MAKRVTDTWGHSCSTHVTVLFFEVHGMVQVVCVHVMRFSGAVHEQNLGFGF